MNKPQASINQALRDAAAKLAATSDTARLDAELLMAEAQGVSRSELLLRYGDAVPPAKFDAFIARRMRHEPVAYILGRQEFFGFEFLVTPDVLIPRSDSECVVEAALEVVSAPRRVLDCGTGSGALLLSVIAQCPGAEGVGVDSSLAALDVAAANAARLGMADRCHMLHRDWHEADWCDGIGQFDLILANPPYVELGADLKPSVRDFEPASALFAGAEGLDDYRKLIPQLPALLEDGGAVVLEIGASQAAAVQQIAALSGFICGLRRDLADRPRAIILRLGLGKGK